MCKDDIIRDMPTVYECILERGDKGVKAGIRVDWQEFYKWSQRLDYITKPERAKLGDIFWTSRFRSQCKERVGISESDLSGRRNVQLQACLVEPPSSTSGRMQLVTHLVQGLWTVQFERALEWFRHSEQAPPASFFFSIDTAGRGTMLSCSWIWLASYVCCDV